MQTSTTHPADRSDMIQVVGAHQNNLNDVTVSIPKRRLTVCTGISGSGKSSLIFGTIAAESQRLVNETYSTFIQGFMPQTTRPNVDQLAGLTTAIAIDQESLPANPRSTVGTVTDALALLRILYSRLGTPQIGGPQAFAFNVPSIQASGRMTVVKGEEPTSVHRDFSMTGGMCPTCEGRGDVTDFILTELYDAEQSLADGALKVPGYSMEGWYGRLFRAAGLPMQKPIAEYTPQELDLLLNTEAMKVKFEGSNLTYEGLIPRIRKSMLSKDREAMQPHVRAFVDRAIGFTTCHDCDGTRLNDIARSVTIDDVNIGELATWSSADLLQWVTSLNLPAAEPLLAVLRQLLQGFVDIGLGYLSLDRASGTLSGGEAQRVKMIRQLGSPLTDVTYVFDEPTAGLHAADVERMNNLLLQLRDAGNTVLVVEHHPGVIAIADHIIDMGPGAGEHGGDVVYQGDLDGLRASGTITGESLEHRTGLKSDFRNPTGTLSIQNVTRHNLLDVAVDIPTGVLTTVTGVAGSGKSTLLAAGLADRQDVVVIDQTPIRGSRRSNPATYTGALDAIRKAFAKAHGVKPGLFSANSDGACPECQGAGAIYLDFGFMQGQSTVCGACQGRRFNAEVLHYELGGRNIADVLELPAEAAVEYFTQVKISAAAKVAQRCIDVGLGYVRLGQPLTTLSGGERQRLKLVASLAKPAEIYVLDEPTTGLHIADVGRLVTLLNAMVDAGTTVIVIEHDLDIVAAADWVIDIGPGAGAAGGRVIFEGTPLQLLEADTPTGHHFAQALTPAG
ncbi:ATP-binding cassette domain-containing protein [Enteractinococcus helveticum]|uniref:UvrABC system protein A n=1 Tax=Enteractinococcus helveticum TaxID=1837282 RepID=A0A1B7LYR6_9MICC|nr:excinuclease ABC subunit UvrA [Enteractinococcus helveticum]OAV60538.1 daunorubicin resistance protein DrrC [Enteractinococcus helveticum]